jgi:catecholate siderophore receptor
MTSEVVAGMGLFPRSDNWGTGHMGMSSMDHASVSRDEGAVARNISAIGWSKAMIGIAAVMLIPDSADAQPASNSDDLPLVRVTAP